jgi:sialidase-1
MTVTERVILYANPIPHLRSRHGYFPGVTVLPDGSLLALFTLGEAFESADATTAVSRSTDLGRSWSFQGLLWPRATGADSDYMKPTTLRDGRVMAMGYRFRREDPDQPLVNPVTNGIRPGEVILSFSGDNGLTWTRPEPVSVPFREVVEASGPVVALRNGDLLAGGGLFMPWDGQFDDGQKGVILRSVDQGRNWTHDVEFYDTPGHGSTPFESRFCEMQDGRIVGLVWAFDQKAGGSLGNRIVVSHDNGYTWSEPLDIGISAQSSSLIWLGGQRLLTIHAHRSPPEGLYVRVIDFTGDQWNVLQEDCIWNGRGAGEYQGLSGMASALRFGQPSLVALPDGQFLAVHWSIEEGQGLIRTHRFSL